MGLIIDTDDELLGLERRRESYGILDLKREFHSTPGKGHEYKSEHIFAYGDGCIEVSNDFLNRLLTWFENHDEERKELRERATSNDEAKQI